tara:strand:+ start:281 stop:634 length:354 start_codon:yes stop_codon:yes gene_type:complete
MSKFEKVINEVTGQVETQFEGKLISIGGKVQENSNGKEYLVGTIQFENSKGDKVQRSAIINKKNFDYGMEIGNSYLCRAVNGEQGVLISVSHLTQAARASVSDFAFESVKSVAFTGA